LIDNYYLEKDNWTTSYLIDNIYNDLIENGSNNDKKQNKYIHHFIDKFEFIRINSPTTFFEISLRDLNIETIKQIENYTNDCKTAEKKYNKLDGIFVEVIARIARQASPMILSLRLNEDTAMLKISLHQIQECVTRQWKIVN
jgi:hypothetical protein